MLILKDNLYQVLPELIYLIFRGDETISVDIISFVEPIIIEKKKWTSRQHVGVKYSNSLLEGKM
jgi:hypothetical protein